MARTYSSEFNAKADDQDICEDVMPAPVGSPKTASCGRVRGAVHKPQIGMPAHAVEVAVVPTLPGPVARQQTSLYNPCSGGIIYVGSQLPL